MAEHLTDEIYACDEWTVDCTVPLYWNDDDAWNDGDPLPGTTTIKGIFTRRYLQLNLGEAGQDSTDPRVRFKTSDIPHAVEGDTITINSVDYTVGTPRADGRGETDIDLFLTV